MRILIFNENKEESRSLGELLTGDDFSVFETSRILEAIHTLKTEDISLVLASQNLDGIEIEEFKELIDAIRPGINILFLGPVMAKGKNLSVGSEEFRKFLQLSLRTETELSHKLSDLKQFFFTFTDRLLQIFEVHDRYFFNNNHLVAELSRKIAEKMGLSRDMVDAIQMAALLRDIGKVGIQHQLLEEKKRLTEQELTPIKNHPLNTVQILKQIKFPWNVDSIISQHHEHYNGGGYPIGLKGREISIGARIIAIADSYYAMTSDRPYRKAIPKEDAIDEIRKKAGTQFDPETVEAFLEVIKELAPHEMQRKCLLILERQPALSAIIKLSVDVNEVDTVHAGNSFDAIRLIKQRTPDIIMADVEMLEKDSFLQFYNVIQEIPSVKDKPFILILPDKDYPRHFRGKKLEYVQKPLNIAELSQKITSLLGKTAPPPSAEEVKGLTGSLEDFNLTDIVQILNIGIKTAKVDISSNSLKGMLYIYRGKLVYASAKGLKGNEAFLEMLRWKTGTFHILHGPTAPEENITMDTIHLLLDASRIFDEEARAKE